MEHYKDERKLTNRDELHKLIDALPEGKLDLVLTVLEEAMEPTMAHDSKGTYGFLLEDEDGWWLKDKEGNG